MVLTLSPERLEEGREELGDPLLPQRDEHDERQRRRRGGRRQGRNKCVNESLKDKDLRTVVDYDAKQLTRRIKHFSRYRTGYTVAE